MRWHFLVFSAKLLFCISNFAAQLPAMPALMTAQRQLPYIILKSDQPPLSVELEKTRRLSPPTYEIPGRRVPTMTSLSALGSDRLSDNAIALPMANALTHVHYHQRRFGQIQESNGKIRLFNPQTVLIKFRGAKHVAALRVEENRELEALQLLGKRKDIEFVELDLLQERQFTANDPQITNQWHHTLIGSFQAWDKTLGQSSVRIAIVDTPFQMDHPDLAANTVHGWDVVENQPVTSSTGIHHSTIGAGIAAAAINNGTGIAGMANCSILPININGAISEMYNAIIWAADNDVRVVNISWTGADSPTLNDAGLYLKNKRGILAMAGVNGTGFLDYPNHPNIYCISMTDAADNMRSRYGNHIDFASPGWEIFSTTVNSGYAVDSGTSYSTPLFCGIVATVFSINPTLTPDETINILKNTAVDRGQTGWDQFYGWGRINFAAAVNAAVNTLPRISHLSWTNNQVAISTDLNSELTYSLWKTLTLEPASWFSVTNAIRYTNGNTLVLTDPTPASTQAFYRVKAAIP